MICYIFRFDYDICTNVSILKSFKYKNVLLINYHVACSQTLILTETTNLQTLVPE